MKIAVISGLNNKKLLSKIEPLLNNEKISMIYLYRKNELNHEKIENRIKKYIKNRFIFEIVRVYKIISDSRRYGFDFYLGVYVFFHGIVAYIMGKVFRKPVIQILPGSDVKYIIEKKRFIKILKGSDFIITRGENTNSELEKLGINKTKMFVIPNVMSFNNIQNLKTPDIYCYDFICISNLVRIKRIDILIKCVSILVNEYKYKKIKIGIIGDGPLRKNLYTLSSKLKIQKNIEFLGHTEDVNSILQKSKIFIMTTEYEGLPQAMIEALANGIPCIMPDVSNIPTIAIHDYNSIIVKPLDIDGFTTAMHKLLSDENYYNRLKGGAENFRAEHEYEYSMKNIEEQWNIIIKNISC